MQIIFLDIIIQLCKYDFFFQCIIHSPAQILRSVCDEYVLYTMYFAMNTIFRLFFNLTSSVCLEFNYLCVTCICLCDMCAQYTCVSAIFMDLKHHPPGTIPSSAFNLHNHPLPTFSDFVDPLLPAYSKENIL